MTCQSCMLAKAFSMLLSWVFILREGSYVEQLAPNVSCDPWVSHAY
jgi:hypothetical protein